MMKNIKFITGLFLLLLLTNARCEAYPWINDLRTLFAANKATIYAVNIRSFGAIDKDGNDIIEPWLGDTPGTFVNGKERLKDIVLSGANTVYLLPITKTGKLKSLGTMGSLYAMDSFNEINPQLDDKEDKRTVYEEAKSFIEAAHKLNLRVIIDLPSCGSYDMALEKPELFIKDKQGKPVVPADWTDVRLFKVYNDDGKLNNDLLKGYKQFADMALALGADGIRADVAAIKPYEFWKELIDYTRKSDPQFLFLAEASTAWSNPAKGYVEYTSVGELLNAGFDGYYGNWSDFKDITKAKEVIDRINTDRSISQKYNDQKSTITSFATHDQLSPMLAGGHAYWNMVLWLSTTLPSNTYILDGFSTGDTFIYKYANQKAAKTLTDDDQYFVHRGQMDIFNAARRPGTKNEKLKEEYLTALKFKEWAKNILVEGSFIPLKTSHPNVFAYARSNGTDAVVVIGNLHPKDNVEAKVFIPKIKPSSFVAPVIIIESPTTKKGHLDVTLTPYEIQVFMLSNIGLK